MATIDQADFEEVTQHVLRNFLQSIGWGPERYLVSKIDPATAIYDSQKIVDRCRALVSRSGDDLTGIFDSLARLAVLLDQHRASSRQMRLALSEQFLRMSAVGCLLVARALLREGKFEEAARFINDGIAIDPQIGALHRELGLLLRMSGDIKGAIAQFQWSLQLRGALRPNHHHLPSDTHLVVEKPREGVEIHYYRSRFYVWAKQPDSVRVMPIGGQLYEIRRNVAYRLARFVMHLPVLRPVLLKVMWRLARGRTAEAGEAPRKISEASATRARFKISLPKLQWRPLARQIAVRAVGRPIAPCTHTLAEAITLAKGPDAAAPSRTKNGISAP